jgi:hypothetical protein
MFHYDVRKWYWIGQPTNYSSSVIYSSAANAIVLATDPGYVAFFNAGGIATSWPKDASGAITTQALDDVLTAKGLPPTGLTPLTQTQLFAYADSKVAALMAVARPYDLGDGVSVLCDGTPSTGANLAGLNTWGQANPTGTQSWIDNFYRKTTITGTQAVTLALAVVAYGTTVYNILGEAVTGIATNSITTTAGIDSLAWPV